MLESSWTDTAGAVAVVSEAAEFDWTWARGDIDRFCSRMGWEEPREWWDDRAIWWARTDIEIEDAVATFRLVGDRLISVTVPVSENGRGAGEFGADAVSGTVAALVEEFDEPTAEWISARYGPSWDFGSVVAGVVHGAAIDVVLVSPMEQNHWIEYRDWREDIRTRAAERLGDKEICFTDAVSGLLRAEFGAWSRAEIDATLAGLGLKSDDPSGKRSDITVEPADDEQRAAFGYGETAYLELAHGCSDILLDNVFQTIFATCRELLGVPDLIGGGADLFVIWNGADTTVELTRRASRYGYGAMGVAVRLSPTDPTQNWLAHEAAALEGDDYDDYDSYDECHYDYYNPDPHQRWHFRPDPARPVRPHFGRATDPTWAVNKWDHFADNLRLLFDSFADELRFVPDIDEIGWAIGIYDELAPIAHGWFSATGCGVHTYDAGGLRTWTYPAERLSGRLVANKAITAIRAPGTMPKELWCEAWLPGRPHGFTAIRFGTRGDRPAARDLPLHW
ncbi:DUF6301 family protein [Nocardia arthritidis]|uniref:Uncharacterized protein n=1 Tax=Nocardia arthritidis TaxID=228602 RepID=A0A6G9YTI8_9NOCA|nr:DUF6301 family protein [Nocardia arthritidis]QIS16645.1 hypothetical protein F5544_44210 [Nocardia arthritidis]